MSPRGRNVGKLARARIVAPTEVPLSFTTARESLISSLVPGTTVERYRRVWHLGQVTVDGDIAYGKIGFESYGGADLWDEAHTDFVETTVPAGVAAPFAIRLTDLIVIFQTRSQDIRVSSFTSALEGLLREASQIEWRVETPGQRTSFTEWRTSVTRVTRLRFRIVQPNPNYEGRPDIERLIEGMRLTSGTLDLRSEDGIDTDDYIAQQLVDHVARGYGEAVAVGERSENGSTVETVFDTKLGGATEVIERPANPETGEVQVDVLREELTQAASEEES